MTTIDKLDISVYNLYAIRTRMVEQIKEQFHLDEAATIPPQIQVINTYAQLTELDLLLGVAAMQTPWAYFFPPQQFSTLRRSPFSFSKVAPSWKLRDEESDEFLVLQGIDCETDEEKEEKKQILNCFKEIKKLNNWLSFIVGRIGQFLQG